MSLPERAVFDCNVLLQGLISPRGPARRLLDAVNERQLLLFLSAYVIDEFREVASRHKVQRKYHLTDALVEKFCAQLISQATFVDDVPHVFDYPRDPDDAHYIDLAVAAVANLIVSRDQDLLSLKDTSTQSGRDFTARFPAIEILTPPELVRRLEQKRQID
jgi:putative PIN family toxin of toxin-antitoxin system